MKKAFGIALCMVAVVLLVEFAAVTDAATCNVSQLSPCLPAFTSSANPTGQCCGKLKEQKPCLCGYLKNPNLRQYVNSPNAKKVAKFCGVQIPNC